MTPERIAELRARWSTGPAHTKGGVTEEVDIAQANEMLDAIIAAQTDAMDVRETLERVKSQRDGGLNAQDRLRAEIAMLRVDLLNAVKVGGHHSKRGDRQQELLCQEERRRIACETEVERLRELAIHLQGLLRGMTDLMVAATRAAGQAFGEARTQDGTWASTEAHGECRRIRIAADTILLQGLPSGLGGGS